VLLAAAVVVAGVVVQARTPDLELEVVQLTRKFSPDGAGRPDTARIRFFVRDSDPNATVQIVGPRRERVRTLYQGPLAAGELVTLSWNGRTATGEKADPRDRYRLRVKLPSQDRDMVYPKQITVMG
jgi:hypothetical protein